MLFSADGKEGLKSLDGFQVDVDYVEVAHQIDETLILLSILLHQVSDEAVHLVLFLLRRKLPLLRLVSNPSLGNLLNAAIGVHHADIVLLVQVGRPHGDSIESIRCCARRVFIQAMLVFEFL